VSEQPQASAKSKHLKVIPFIIIIVVLASISGVGWHALHAKSASATNSASGPVQYNPNAGESLGSVPATTPAPTPTVLLDQSGSGSVQTKPFTTTGDWTVTYTFDCSAYGSSGNFQTYIDNTDGSYNTDTGANELATSGGNTDYYYDAGEHYIEVNSECSWHITVKG